LLGAFVALANIAAVVACGVAAYLWARAADFEAPNADSIEGADGAIDSRDLQRLSAQLQAQARRSARAAAWTTVAMAAQASALVAVLLAAGLS
jgi:hypothetical protein